MADELASLLAAHADDIEAIAASFERDLTKAVEASMRDVSADLKRRLEVTNGVVLSSAANQQILSELDNLLLERMQSNGYEEALRRYTESFNGQYVAFEEVLKHINSKLEWPLPQPKFNSPLSSELEAQKLTARTLIEDAVQTAAIAAKRTALTSIGAVSPKELAESISAQLDKSIGQAESLADTGISSFYRAINDKGFQAIEEDLPGFRIRYAYEGPLDILTRPFCAKLQAQANSGKSWTRTQIDAMKNGQLPNVWLTAGGYRCRHQWIVDTNDLKQQQQSKPKPEGSRSRPANAIKRELKARRVLSSDRIKRAIRPTAQVKASREQARQKVSNRRGKK